MADRRAERLQALAGALDGAHLDALLVSGLANVRYLTGFSGSNALLLVTPAESLLLTDARYAEQAVAEAGEVARVDVQAQSLWAGLWQRLPAYPAQVVGFESMHLVHRDFQRLLEAGGRWQWRPTVDVVESHRERKTPEEVEAIRRAGAMATSALSRVLPRIRAGLTELAIAGLLEQALREEGSEGFPFPTIVASGPRAALPHARSSERVVGEGDFLLMDFGAQAGGYCADVTRTVVVGRASPQQREVYDVVREAQALAMAGVRAGMRGRDADALARDYIERRGHGERFQHSLGHGLGLEVHEAPRLARQADAALAEGAVVTIEPGVYVPGWGGVRIEDDVHLGPAGPELLTHFPRELLEIG